MSARVWRHLGDRDGCYSTTGSLQTAAQVLNFNSRGLDIHIFTYFHGKFSSTAESLTMTGYPLSEMVAMYLSQDGHNSTAADLLIKTANSVFL